MDDQIDCRKYKQSQLTAFDPIKPVSKNLKASVPNKMNKKNKFRSEINRSQLLKQNISQPRELE